jgi:rubrerythrin
MMGVKFNVSDIVEMGIQIEKNGKEYYAEVMGCAKSEKTKDIFRFLGNEEEKHINYFENLLASLEKEEMAESYPGEYHEYIEHLSGLHIFTKKGAGKTTACKMKSDKEALETAAGLEKDTILFYHEMKTFISGKDKEVIEKIIQEEQKHLSKLLGFLKTI